MIDFDFNETFCAAIILDIAPNHVFDGMSVLNLVKRNIASSLNKNFEDFRVFVSGTGCKCMPLKTGESVNALQTFKTPVGRNFGQEFQTCCRVLNVVTDVKCKKCFYIFDKLNLNTVKRFVQSGKSVENCQFVMLQIGTMQDDKINKVVQNEENISFHKIENPNQLSKFFGDNDGR